VTWSFWRRNREQDLERELRDHLDLEAEDSGDPDAARRALGNLTKIKEDVREAWGWATLEIFRQDLKYALRQMRRTPGFTAIAVLTLALGLGTTTAIFSIVNGVLLEPLKYRDPGRLFLARTLPPPQANLARDFPVNAGQFERWRSYCRACDRMALVQFLELTLVGAGDPVRLPGLSVTADFFRTLDVQPALGRDFLPDDDAGHVILTDSLWRSRFAADPSIVGRTIQLNGEAYPVIGVMPPDLHLPKGDEWGGFSGPAQAPLIFRPVGHIVSAIRLVGNLNYSALIRLKPGVSRDHGIAELNGLLADVYREYQLETRITLIPLQQQVTRDARSALWLLFATVGTVLLIVCVNVGNLMLVRTAGRYREAGVRLALGASRSRLFALVLEEALVLVAVGAALGLALASATLRILAATASVAVPRLEDVQIDWRVLLFAAAAAALATIICGLIPAWRLSRTEPVESMKAASAASTEGRGKLRLREAMVSLEVALSTVLLMIGGLLSLSLWHVLRVEKGFDVARVITQDVSFLNPKYRSSGNRRFVEETIPKLAAIPGVESAAATNRLPLEGEDWVGDLIDPDQPPRSADQAALANNRFVTPGYWKALGIPLKQGRYLDESDSNKPTAVISERAARFLWGDQNPIGKRVVGAGPTAPKLEIVGVVGEVHGTGLERPVTMMIYEHYWRMRPMGMSFVVRTRADPAAVAASIHALLAQADPEMAIPGARTMEQIVHESVASRKFQMYLAAAFAIAALLLASLGIYGVISFSVARRTPEIGIRIALGARAAELTAMILREGMLPVAIGLAAGLLAALFVGRIISSQLYGVASNDPLTIFAVVVILLAVAYCACWFPARRATRVDPLVALRFE
jgi:putative ABC transport system permease protein